MQNNKIAIRLHSSGCDISSLKNFSKGIKFIMFSLFCGEPETMEPATRTLRAVLMMIFNRRLEREFGEQKLARWQSLRSHSRSLGIATAVAGSDGFASQPSAGSIVPAILRDYGAIMQTLKSRLEHRGSLALKL